VHTSKETHRRLVNVSKCIGLELNADKTNYLVITRDQNTGNKPI